MEAKEIIKIDTIQQLSELLDIHSQGHPLLSIVRLSGHENSFNITQPVQLNLFSVAMKDGCNGNTRYGWREYDFSKGLMNFFAPGQIHTWSPTDSQPKSYGWVLAFHPDFIRKYPLALKIGKYKFFSYQTNEALHMSDAEQLLVEQIFENIQKESHQNIDEHSQNIIISQLELLLSYSERFYTRQFRTRHSVEDDLITKFESILHKHFDSNNNKLISASDIAAELAMSTSYLNDLLRNFTGMNTQQHIHAHIIDKAKILLQNTNLSVNEIAYSLGFEYPQYFNRLFKNKTKQTPVQFRNFN